MSDFRYLFFSSTILLIVGVLDDYHEISAVAKFIGQGLVAATMVLAGGLEIPNVGDIFMWEDGNTLGTGVLAAPLTIIAIVGVVNSMNMVDGHDGLAGSIFLVTACSLIIIAGASESWKLQYLISLFVVAVLVFLVFNLPFAFAEKNKIFLGDAGSMLLGLILVWMMLELVIEPGVLKAVSGPWLLGVPLLDMFCVISLRIMSRISPLVADRQHLHHFLSDWGLSKRLVLLVILLIHLGFCLIGVFGSLYDWPDAMLFWPMFLIFGIYLFVRIRFEPR